MSRLFDVAPYTTEALELQTANGAVDDTTLGAIAEAIVGVRCLERGLDVARPAADAHGVDLVIAGRRVQVKSTRRPRLISSSSRTLHYRFKAGGGVYRPSGWTARRYDEIARRCDAFAFYAHDSGRLWLATSAVVVARWRSEIVNIAVNERAMLDDFSVLEHDRPAPDWDGAA